jgi:2-oxoglutarate ferredoxin oxidoreductase subunit beta
MIESPVTLNHSLDVYLRTERLPHIWCPGCGLGVVLNTFLRSLLQTEINIDKVAIVSGIGCAGRMAGYIKMDSFHVTHGRALPFATGLKIANPELKVVVISGDGDLFAIGGNHLIHAARRNMDITVICANNFIYGMTGGQFGPTTPTTARTTTTRRGNIEPNFNIPHLVAAAGATYIARWTIAQVHEMQNSITEALLKNGFSFVEIINPCPTYYGRMNVQPSGLDQMRYYRDNAVVRHNIDTSEVDIGFSGQIIVGKFLDIERPYLPKQSSENVSPS